MRKFIGLIFAVLLWCNFSFADNYLLKSIEILENNLEKDSNDIVFYVSEVSNAVSKPQKIALNCYRDLVKNNTNYFSSNCNLYRNIFSNSNNHFRKTFMQLENIFINLKNKAINSYFNDLQKSQKKKYDEDILIIEEFIQINVKILQLGLRFS